jgi:membrane protein YqaA with SNARE-associated domain
MHHLVAWIEGFARAIGGPGLFIIAFLDASVLSLPEINDLLIVWMVTTHKERMLFYVAMATAGSTAGCFVIYVLGRRGADAFLRRHFGEAQIVRAERLMARYGFLAVLVPAILPPPAPFKIFVLLAGVGAMPVRRFAAAIAIGRGARYLGEGVLAVKFGDRATEYLRTHGVEFAIWTIAGIGGVVALYYAWRRWTAPAG